MKIIFMGTPKFSVPALKALNNEHQILSVITQTDKPTGRARKLCEPAVKRAARELELGIVQPVTLKNQFLLPFLKTFAPDIIIVVAYGRILPKYIIDFPKYGCVNAHASLLPKYRGAAPIHWSVINGERVTGITTMYMDEGMDTGDILLTKEISIESYDTTGTMFTKLSSICGEVLLETLAKIEDKSIVRIKQNNDLATYAPMVDRQTGLIDWSKKAQEIINLIRGTNPYPVAYTTYNGKKLKIYQAELGLERKGQPGEIFDSSSVLEVVAGDNVSVIIKEIQPENKNKMSVLDYLNGHKLEIGTKFQK